MSLLDALRAELAGMLADRELQAARYRQWATSAAADADIARGDATDATTTADRDAHTRNATALEADRDTYTRRATALDTEITRLRRTLGR